MPWLRVQGAVAVLAAAVAATGCTEFFLLNADPRPARPSGCAVALIPPGSGGYAAEIVAQGTARCRKRDGCVDELRKQACRLGAQAVSWERETPYGDHLEIYASFLVPMDRSAERELWPEGGCLQPDKGSGLRASGRR